MGKNANRLLKDLTKLKVKDIRVSEPAVFPVPNYKIDIKFIGRNLQGRFARVNRKALEYMRSELALSLNEAMLSTSWGEMGAIYDTGRLMNSLTIDISGNSLVIEYSEPYAALVHYGGYILPYGNENASRVYIPGRPWAESVVFGNGPVPGFDFESVYRRALSEVFK